MVRCLAFATLLYCWLPLVLTRKLNARAITQSNLVDNDTGTANPGWEERIFQAFRDARELATQVLNVQASDGLFTLFFQDDRYRDTIRG
jgi:hypothetical protein